MSNCFYAHFWPAQNAQCSLSLPFHILYFYFDGTWSGQYSSPSPVILILSYFEMNRVLLRNPLSRTIITIIIILIITNFIIINVQNRFNILRARHEWDEHLFSPNVNRSMTLNSILSACFCSSTNWPPVRGECKWIKSKCVRASRPIPSTLWVYVCVCLLTASTNKILSRFRSTHTPVMECTPSVNQIKWKWQHDTR